MTIDLRENEPLCLHTTLRTGGPARFFVAAKTVDEIKEAVDFANLRRMPLFVLGGGSNLLAADHGFPGVVIRIATCGIRMDPMSSEMIEASAEAGEDWDALVACAVEHGLFGLENMSLIPGTVGAAVIGNIGAYGAEVKDILLWAEALDRRTGLVRRFTRSECEFGYRRSFFKTLEGRNFIITRAGFGLRRRGTLNTTYGDVREYFSTRGITAPTLAEGRAAVISIRRRKLPDLAQVGTAGSFFKNPVIARAAFEALVARHPGLPGHDESNDLVKVPLGWILDKVCGLKGVRHGRVGTHSQQALVIVNEDGTATEVEAFANVVAQKVREMTGLEIEWEVERMG